MFSELDFEQMLRDAARLCDAKWSPDETEQVVIMIRLELYNRGVACGPKAICTRMDESYGIKPLPSERTIARMLAANGLTHGRIGWCDGDETWLPVSAHEPDGPYTSTGGELRSTHPRRPVAELIAAPAGICNQSMKTFNEDTIVTEALTRRRMSRHRAEAPEGSAPERFAPGDATVGPIFLGGSGERAATEIGKCNCR